MSCSRFILSLCAVLLLSACSRITIDGMSISFDSFATDKWRASLGKLQDAKRPASAYHRALADAYQQLSEQEAGRYDWEDSSLFAEKGLQATRGEEVFPGRPETWGIPEEYLAPLQQARVHLLDTLTGSVKEAAPEEAASAITLFDCWLEEQEENWQSERIDGCRRDFFETLDILSIIAAEVEQKETVQEIVEEEKPEAIPAAQREVVSTYVLFFDHASGRLSTKGNVVIKRLIDDLKQSSYPYELVLNGYSDRAGSEAQNLLVAKKRADTVKKALIAAGIPEKQITVFSFGEADPAVPTADGVKESANRRVEIRRRVTVVFDEQRPSP